MNHPNKNTLSVLTKHELIEIAQKWRIPYSHLNKKELVKRLKDHMERCEQLTNKKQE